MTRARLLLLVAAMIAIVVAVYVWRQSETQPPQPAPPAQPESRVEAPPAPAPPPAAPAEPQVLHPIETAQQLGEEGALEPGKETTTATLDESDVAMQDALAGLYGAEAPGRYFYLNDLVRRIVVTVDNLPRKQVSSRLSPMKPPSGLFVTRGEAGSLYVSPENYARYTPYVRLLQSADPKKVVAVYVRLYPLFQQAYQELGYPKGYFNDRLVEVIDHLLAAPDVQGPIKLVQPRVLYQFEDPTLEALSAGEKALIRMGSENADKVKVYLRAIRQALTGQLPPQ
jgi:Protein of unknown function (DUF3014)